MSLEISKFFVYTLFKYFIICQVHYQFIFHCSMKSKFAWQWQFLRFSLYFFAYLALYVRPTLKSRDFIRIGLNTFNCILNSLIFIVYSYTATYIGIFYNYLYYLFDNIFEAFLSSLSRLKLERWLTIDAGCMSLNRRQLHMCKKKILYNSLHSPILFYQHNYGICLQASHMYEYVFYCFYWFCIFTFRFLCWLALMHRSTERRTKQSYANI